jgi:uridine monophosphate synthetase
MQYNKKIPYAVRASYCTNPTAKTLCELMAEKKTNLCFSADISDPHTLLNLVEVVGSEICLLKTHVDILTRFDKTWIQSLQNLAKKQAFLIFEDRKFADIGHTVQQQYGGGLYHIADWADIVNAHIVPGPGIIEGLKSVGLTKQRGLLLLAQMSSQGSWAQGDYTQANVALAEQHRDFVIGFIAQHQLSDHPGLLHLTPGVQWQETQDSLGQQYISPEQAIIQHKTDIVIVGRGIYQAENPREQAQRYRKAAWDAYQQVL